MKQVGVFPSLTVASVVIPPPSAAQEGQPNAPNRQGDSSPSSQPTEESPTQLLGRSLVEQSPTEPEATWESDSHSAMLRLLDVWQPQADLGRQLAERQNYPRTKATPFV